MNRPLLLLFVLCFAVPAVLVRGQDLSPTPEQRQKRLTYEDTNKPVGWTSAAPTARIAWDGKHVEYRDASGGKWFDPATRTDSEPLQPDASAAAPEANAGYVARLQDNDVYLNKRSTAADAGGGRRGRRGSNATSGGDSETIQITKDGTDAPRKSEAHCNATGTRASYVMGGNLFVVEAATKEVWQVTSDGSEEMLHGVLDWVYQEEIYGRGDFQGHWWSPKGDLVALLSLDESKVREFTIVNHVPAGFLDTERSVTTEVTNYPKVGDPNPTASLSIVDTSTKARTVVDLAGYPSDVLVVRVGWTEDQKSMLVILQDRIQTWADLCAVDPKTGVLTRLVREESTSWVNRPEMPRFLADGTYLWLSERTGYNHVYRYQKGGELLGAVTSGDWQVRSIERIDETSGQLWFEGTKDGATGRHLYRIGLDGTGLVCLTPGIGTHQAELSEDGSFLVDRWSAMDQPPSVRVLDGKDGSVLKELGRAELTGAKEYAFADKLRLSIAARDGYLLDASLMLPPDRKPGAVYPIHLPTYSGPDAPTVRDAWSPSAYQIFMAQQGFLVLQVNVRSASGRGHKDISTCYKQLGVQELKDLEDAVAFVCKEHQGDAARVAIEGWSYGGFMAAYALTHSDKFALGLAGAGVYDWRLYDTIYTERYMAMPDTNSSGYDATSVIKAAKNLKGHLVLQHGSMDDNVHLQNTMQLLWELQKAGKQNFELMIYPRSQHGPNPQVAGHVRDFQWRALMKLLDKDWKPE